MTNTKYAQHLPGGFRAPSLDEEFVEEHVARKRDACVIKAVMSILSISQLPAAHATSKGGLHDGLNAAGILSISQLPAAHATSNDAGITLAAAIRCLVCLPATHATSNGGLHDGLNDAGILNNG